MTVMDDYVMGIRREALRRLAKVHRFRKVLEGMPDSFRSDPEEMILRAFLPNGSV
ncbi:hypothetical protein [Arthrobacter sp.]|uniref:hypothetical protein n=1 Tax=Arthrobacter sp. TaxID=1667 RepID=UPI0026E0460E|nr:hypothetical protein [Arthrobacter sp.]MDO5753323.1 hypothetical protein [Arthrobacter sp.]